MTANISNHSVCHTINANYLFKIKCNSNSFIFGSSMQRRTLPPTIRSIDRIFDRMSFVLIGAVRVADSAATLAVFGETTELLSAAFAARRVRGYHSLCRNIEHAWPETNHTVPTADCSMTMPLEPQTCK